jgi:CHAT domain-containing protein
MFVAGAPRVVVTGWRVPDRATRLLVEDFYLRWTKRGETPVAALRSAKRLASKTPERAHPAHWASLTLWGLPD